MLSRLAFVTKRIRLNGLRSISTLKEVPGSLSLYLNNCALKEPNYSSKLDSYTHDELLYSLQSIQNTKLNNLDDKELEGLITNPDFTGVKLEFQEVVVENENTKEVLNELGMIIKENKLKDQLIWKELVNTIEVDNNKRYLKWKSLNGSINPSIKSENNETYRLSISKTLEEITSTNKENEIVISDNITNIGLIPYTIYKYIKNNNNGTKKILEIHMNSNNNMTIEVELPTKDLIVKYKPKTTIPTSTTTISENITRIIMNDNNLKRINNTNEIHYLSFNNKDLKSVLSKDILQRCKLYSINNEDLNSFLKCMNNSKSDLKIKELYLENFLDISNQKLSLYSDIKSVLPRINKDLEYEVDHLNKQLKNVMDFVTKNVEDSNVIANSFEKIMKECNLSRVLNVENLFSKQKNICSSYDELISLNDRDLEEIDTIAFDNNENINSTKFEEILKVLPKIPNLKSIEILKSDIIDPDLLEFDEYLKTNPNLEKLKIVSHKLSFLSFSSLLSNINPHIKELSMSSDLYNDAVTLILNNHLPKLPDLERLELYGYKLSATELEKVYKNVDAYCPNMKYLSLPYVKNLKNETNSVIGRYGIHNYEIGFTDACITVPEMQELYDIHPNLQFGYLECVGLNNENVRKFSEYMKINKNLSHLFITEGSISSENISCLFDSIDKLNIEVLSFKKCKFNEEELIRLCERINEFEIIDDLEIEDCNMTAKSLSLLLDSVKSLKNIRRLNIAGLKINDEIVSVLKCFKTISPKFESLALGNNSMNPEVLIDLIGSELFNKTIVLTLKNLNIKSYQTHKVFNALESMPKIGFVILDGCETNEGMMKDINELNLKYEIVQPERTTKKTNWLTLILGFVGLYLVMDYFERSDNQNKNNNKQINNHNEATEVLPNNNDVHKLQSYDDHRYYNNNNDGYYLQHNNSNYSTSEDLSADEYSGGSAPHGFNR